MEVSSSNYTNMDQMDKYDAPVASLDGLTSLGYGVLPTVSQTAAPSTGTSAVAAAALHSVTPPPAPITTPRPALKPEDDQGGDGAEIDTFSKYQPTALPPSIVKFCNDQTHNGPNCVDGASSSLDLSSSSSSSSTSTLSLLVPSHTSIACESALLSSVSAPTVHCDAAESLLPLLRKKPGALSPLQLEGVLLAIQRHRRIENIQMPSNNSNNNGSSRGGYRAGFFLGDGAGIGKGRQISAVLRDAFSRGRKRHLWLSVSRELIQDAKRDLGDVGVYCDVHDGTQLLSDRHSALGRSERGVMFLTYQLLVSNTRLESIISWCAGTEILKRSLSAATQVRELEHAFDGCIVFDEAHKAKNLADDTKTAKLVLELQRRLPRARVLYCSATGVSDVAQLAYAERLGLWGTNDHTTTAELKYNHFSNFKAFQSSLEKRGLGSMELLALELKTRGSFMARTLSWDGAEFRTEEVSLTAKQQRIYNDAVVWWNKCKESLDKAFKILETDRSTPSMVFRTFWAAHQRFFKEMAICAKIPYLAKDAMSMIDDGCVVVIGLQSTGETALQNLLHSDTTGSDKKPSKITKVVEIQQFPTLLSTALITMTGFVEKNFPTTPSPQAPPTLPNRQPASPEERLIFQSIQAEIDRMNSLPPPQPLPVLVELKEALIRDAMAIQLPPNPLDDLIDRLGGEGKVAEMTGRDGRIVKVGPATYQYKKRSTDKVAVAAVSQDDAADRINIVERRMFMDGMKSVAIISDAASTGISLHAAKGSRASHKRRVHYTIELPWSADKAVQQLGRSHRSGQESAPIYKLVVTDLGGERRFAAAVSKRLASLGALTKGDRRAATGSDMSDFDLDSKYGKRALKRFYKSVQDSHTTPSDVAVEILPSRKSTEIMVNFTKSTYGQGFSEENGTPNYSALLSLILFELERLGIDEAIRGKADVRTFLNRLAGVPVAHQAFIFSLFMSTLDDVIQEAKSSGEFEGTAEDIKATSIEIGDEMQLIVDPSCGVHTKLTTLHVDRGISLPSICAMAIQEALKEKKVVALKCDHETNKQLSHGNTNVNGRDDDEDDDEDDDDDGNDNAHDDDDGIWFSQSSRYRADGGFYISKGKIAGRRLVLMAKGKFDRSLFETDEEAANFDPMGLMLVTRPNTGTSHTDMTSPELKRKYNLACSFHSLCQAMDDDAAEISDEAAVELVSKGSALTTKLWKCAFEESNSFEHKLGLFPRRYKLSIVTGPILHVLPMLEMVVQFRSERDRAMRIIRATVGDRIIVGPRFPSDEESRKRLQEEIAKAAAARSSGNTFLDEDFVPICSKSDKWATTERPTIKSFFTFVSGKTKGDKDENFSKNVGQIKRGVSVSTATSSSKKMKTTSMTSFFAPKMK